jgi:uncharacterized spore protein YtfJ
LTLDNVVISKIRTKEKPMTEEAKQPTKIDQQLAGPQITVGGRTVQPLARLTGQRGEEIGPTGGGAGAWMRLTPVEVIVSNADGTERHIAIGDPTARALWGMAGVAGLVAVASAVLILLARLLGQRD